MCTADIVLGYAELMKPVTCVCESERSTVSESPFLVTVARMWTSLTPWPSSSRIASPLNTPSFVEAVVVHQLEQPPLPDAGRAHHGPQVALEVARVPHVGRHHLQHVVAQLAAVVELERGDADPFLPDLGGARVVGPVGRAADVVLVRPVDRPEHRPAAHEDREQDGEIGQVIVAVVRVVQEEQVAGGDPSLEEVGHRRHRPGQGPHVDRHVLGLRGEPPLAVEHRGGEIAARVQDLRVGGA